MTEKLGRPQRSWWDRLFGRRAASEEAPEEKTPNLHSFKKGDLVKEPNRTQLMWVVDVSHNKVECGWGYVYDDGRSNTWNTMWFDHGDVVPYPGYVRDKYDRIFRVRS